MDRCALGGAWRFFCGGGGEVDARQRGAGGWIAGRPTRSAGSKARAGPKRRHRLDSRRNPEGFLRSGRLKSCFGEHDFSLLFSLPGLKPLRSVFQSPCTLIRLHPVPALGAGRGEEGRCSMVGGGRGRYSAWLAVRGRRGRGRGMVVWEGVLTAFGGRVSLACRRGCRRRRRGP